MREIEMKEGIGCRGREERERENEENGERILPQ